MNKEILRLLELLEILNKTDSISENFKCFAEQFEEDDHVTVEELIEAIEDEMSYWEE
jgi:hypothetical protein